MIMPNTKFQLKSLVIAFGVIVLQINYFIFRYSSDKTIVTKIPESPTNASNPKSGFLSKQNYFPSSCECQSLFTINACNKTNPPRLNGIPITGVKWKNLMKDLSRFRGGEYVNIRNFMFDLARYIPTSYHLDFQTRHKFENHSESKKNMSEIFTAKPLPVLFQNGFVSCDVFNYSVSDIKKCTNSFKITTGQPLRIYFIGDSIIRVIMEEIVRQTHAELRLKFKGPFELNLKKNFLDHKLKINIPISGDGIEYRLYWAPFLEKNRNPNNVASQGIKDLLKLWANEDNYTKLQEHPLPDIIYMGTGYWKSTRMNNLASIEEYLEGLRVLKDSILKISQKVRILWHFHHLVEKWMFYILNPVGSLSTMNQISWLKFVSSRVWIWESLAAFQVKEKKECLFYSKNNLTHLLPMSWTCSDVVHPGKITSQFGVNMIWNLACNRMLGLKKNFCCF